MFSFARINDNHLTSENGKLAVLTSGRSAFRQRAERTEGTNTRKIEIYYSFVGQVDTGEAHAESVSFFRQIGADVKSYAV